MTRISSCAMGAMSDATCVTWTCAGHRASGAALAPLPAMGRDRVSHEHAQSSPPTLPAALTSLRARCEWRCGQRGPVSALSAHSAPLPARLPSPSPTCTPTSTHRQTRLRSPPPRLPPTLPRSWSARQRQTAGGAAAGQEAGRTLREEPTSRPLASPPGLPASPRVRRLRPGIGGRVVPEAEDLKSKSSRVESSRVESSRVESSRVEVRRRWPRSPGSRGSARRRSWRRPGRASP